MATLNFEQLKIYLVYGYIRRCQLLLTTASIIPSSICQICVEFYDTPHDQMDLEEAVGHLNNIGYTESIAVMALSEAKYNIKNAIKYIANNQDAILNNLSSTTNNTNRSITNAVGIKRILQMGYDSEQAKCALAFCDQNVKNAINCLVQDECYGNILDCKHLLRFVSFLNQYHTTLTDNLDIIAISNDFNHLLLHHDGDKEFDFIFNKFNKCDASKCQMLKRHYRIHDDDKKTSQNNYTEYEDIMNKIHCHFMHCYDIGRRLTLIERQKLQQICVNKNKDSLLHQILDPKHKLYSHVNVSVNKFNQIRHHRSKHKVKNFHFGQIFYYWSYFKDLAKPDGRNIGYYYKDWYIEPKYKDLKNELINNDISTLNMEEWKLEYNTAKTHLSTDYGKSIKAQPNKCIFPKKAIENQNLYEIKLGSPISINHLVAIMVYCGFSTFRRNSILSNAADNSAFAKGHDPRAVLLRRDKLENETDASLKQRHRNFYHMSKHITETVNVFSGSSWVQNKRQFYHGISKKLLFYFLTFELYQPLSTTSSLEVALNFSQQNGMILQISPHINSNYFDCAWISKFSSEKELLFIRSPFPLRLQNITNVSIWADYQLEIAAISIIESLTRGGLHGTDWTIPFSVMRDALSTNAAARNRAQQRQVQTYGGTTIDPRLKLLTIRLIKHQLYNSRVPYKGFICRRFEQISPYADQLLDNICVQKEILVFNWTLMSIEVAQQCETFGYQGYAFLKHLLYKNTLEYQFVNLHLIFALFLKCKYIFSKNMSSISSQCLSYILSYLSENNPKYLSVISLALSVETTDMKQLTAIITQFKSTFQCNGWDIAVERKRRTLTGVIISRRKTATITTQTQ